MVNPRHLRPRKRTMPTGLSGRSPRLASDGLLSSDRRRALEWKVSSGGCFDWFDVQLGVVAGRSR